MRIEYAGFSVPGGMDDKFATEHCLFVGVSGAHSFGWATPKSDLDLRIVYFQDIGQLVSPFFKCHTKAWTKENIDTVEYPIDHYLELLLKGNGNAVDNLFEPKIIEKKDAVKELQDIIKSHIHKGFISHCLGYGRSIKNDFTIPSRLEKYGENKLMLCMYRVMLQGLNLLEGNIEHNLPQLFEKFAPKYGQPLLSAYLKGEPLTVELKENVGKELVSLEAQLISGFTQSTLPDLHHSTLDVALDTWIKQKYLGSRNRLQTVNSEKKGAT